MRPKLARLAAEQGGVFTRAQAVAVHGRRDAEARLRSGEWVTVCRGVLATREVYAAAMRDPARRHLLRGAAAILKTRRPAVLSHEYAATVLGIPLLHRLTGPPTLTVDGPAPRTSGGVTGRHVAPVPAAQQMKVGRVSVTTPARTVADLCRTEDTRSALVVADAALHRGLDRSAVAAVLAGCRRWPHVVAARQHTALASPWSESPLESLSLRWCREQGLPTPEQQLTVRSEGGRFVARVDLVWEEHRTVGELDGRMKYVGDEPVSAEERRRRERALWREKLREDVVRDLGLQVVRGYWSDDADDGAAFAERARRAFARGASYTGNPTYRIFDERDHAHRGPLAASNLRHVAGGGGPTAA